MLDSEPDHTTPTGDGDTTSATAAPTTPPRRRRAASRPAGPPTPVPQVQFSDDGAAAPVTDAASAETPAPPAPAEASAVESPAPAKKASRRAPRKRAAVRETADLPVTNPVADEAPPEQAPAEVAPADETLAEVTPVEETPADESPAEVTPADETAADETAADETAADETPADETAADETAAEETPTDETAADSTDSSDDDSDEDDSDDGQDGDASSGSRRRRRRRGGRRRRRPGGDDDQDSGDHDQPDATPSFAPQEARGETRADAGSDAQDTQDDTAADRSTAKAESTEDAKSEQSDGNDSDGNGRRRRRRRRRGEDSGGAPDDPTDVVERVREPRTRKRASSEITGIEGSTRMEAKRQRRREGREAGRRRAPILSEAEFLARRESVKRTMIVRQHDDLSQIAVLEDGVLVEHYVDRDSAASLIGNVYLGRVQNVLPSMEAAFIDIGRGRNAVLYAGEIAWESFDVDKNERKVEKVLKSGQTILVQVSKDPVGAKGARLINHVTLPGRYIVYSPDGHLSGISRKLPDTERKRLRDVLSGLVEDPASVVVRTAAEGTSEDELVRDVNRLKAQWEDIERKVKTGQAPQLLYGEPDLTLRIVRDLFTEDFSELVIQGNGSTGDAWDAVSAYVSHIAPHLQDRLVRWNPDEQGDLFAAHRLDEQIAKGLERKVFLPSGGSLIIDRTEAMTVIDVNTGKFTGSGGNLEATITSNNLEAAEEIVRQLRLRDIGGIIVIDFIDMVLPANRELLLRRLVECLGRDRTRHQVAEVTSLGLVQMTRKKIGTGLIEAFSEPCPHCQGRGVELHDMPVETQKQADGGARESGGRQQNNGGDRRGRGGRGGQNGGGQNGGGQNGGGQNGGGEKGGGQNGGGRGGRRGGPQDVHQASTVVDEPVVEEPVVEEPVIDEPVVGETAIHQSVDTGTEVDQSQVEVPDVEEPDVEVPDAEVPAVEEPTVEVPAVESEPAETAEPDHVHVPDQPSHQPSDHSAESEVEPHHDHPDEEHHASV